MAKKRKYIPKKRHNPEVQARKIENTAGDTVIGEYQNMHFDIKNLNYDTLGIVKDIILDCLRNNFYKTITKKTLKEILHESANKTKILDKSLLNEKLQATF